MNPLYPFGCDADQKLAHCLAKLLADLPGFSEVGLFGSIIKGTNAISASDVDLLCVFDDSTCDLIERRIQTQAGLAEKLASAPVRFRNDLGLTRPVEIRATIVSDFELSNDLIR